MSYFVSQSTRDIEIRMALGAEVRDVLRMVLGQGALLALAGVVLGVCGALALTRYLATYLYATSHTDAVTFVGAPLILLATALVAGWLPARRAARVDPMTALRHE